jgi:hypothetical protein
MSLFNFIDNDQKIGKLLIYSNDYLLASTVEEQDQAIALEFDSLLRFEFVSEVTIAEKNIENSDFRNDSMHDNANKVLIRAVKMRSKPDDTPLTNEQAENLVRSLTICTIVQRYPLLRQFNNYKFVKYEYILDGSCNTLVPTMTFQEIRTGATEFGENNAFNNNAQANPDNVSQIDSGNVSPVPITGTPTFFSEVTS